MKNREKAGKLGKSPDAGIAARSAAGQPCKLRVRMARSITPGLLGQVERFARICFIDCWPMHEYRKEVFMASLARSLKHEGRLCLATQGETLGAYAWIETGFNRHEKRKYGEIKFFYVNPECREHGIGTRMMDECLGYFRKKGAEYATLAVSQLNRGAIAFYGKRGFAPYSCEMYMKL